MYDPTTPVHATPSSSKLLSLPNELLLFILRHVFTGAKIKALNPRERALIHARRSERRSQSVKKKLKFWSRTSKSPQPEIVPSRSASALSILQTSKTLDTLGRPLLWETVILDFSTWLDNEVIVEARSHKNIPLHKFQNIRLSAYNLTLGIDSFESLRSLSIESGTNDLCKRFDIDLDTLISIERYQRRPERFEVNMLLTDSFGRQLRFIIDQQARFELVEAWVDWFDNPNQIAKLMDAVNDIQRIWGFRRVHSE